MGSIIDYLIVVPLDEEAGYISEVMETALGGATMESFTVGPQVYSRAIIETKAGSASVVILSVGRMTEAPFQAAVTEAITLWRPSAAILIGIAGSLDAENLRLGDIIVPRKILGYTEAKAEPDDGGGSASTGYRLVYRPTGHSVDCVLAAQARALKLNNLKEWQAKCVLSASQDAVLGEVFLSGDGRPREPKVHNHDNDVLVSGNVVVASKAFADALRRSFGDAGRMIKAVEMEAKGFCEAMDRVEHKPRTLIVRGISDYADELKASLEAGSKDRWRRLAGQNAARFVLAFVENRPTIEEGYRSVALPSLRMVPAVESARLCMREGIDAREAGMRNVAMAPLLVCEDGCPAMSLEIHAYDGAGRMVGLQDVVLRMANGPEILRRREPGTLKHSLRRSADPVAWELYAGLSREAHRIVSVATDEFGRSYESACEFQGDL